jgi:pentatricopeptide repeat protein
LIKFGFRQVLSLQNQILSVCLKCKEIENAEKLFEELPERNVVSWNIIIRGIVGSCDFEKGLNHIELCFSYFRRILMEMVVPDYITCNGLICLCAMFHDFEMGIQLHFL